MAQKSISRLDAFDFVGSEPAAATGAPDSLASDSLSWGPQATHAVQASPADLALDLVLREMLQQARLESSATGASVVLVGASEIRRRATAGATAGEVDDYLEAHTKVVDTCLRSGAVQRCDDTESDTRFDVAACRRLGLRCLLICRIQCPEEKTVGVIELFSSRPGAFADRDVLMLQAIGQRIVNNLEAVRKLPAQVAPEPIPREAARSEISQPSEPLPVRSRPMAAIGPRVRKPFQLDSKLFLMGAAITLSIILGWMLGRTQDLTVTRKIKPRSAPTAQVAPAPRSDVAQNAVTPTQTAEDSVPAVQLLDSAPAATVEISRTPKTYKVPPLEHSSAPPQDTLSVSAKSSPDSVVLFEDEKSASPQTQPAGTSAADAKGIDAAVSHDGVPHLAAETAVANLLVRVEPDYPDKAREQKIQGSVVLDVVVGKDGKVQGISAISGDPQLVLAAAHAVQQWRFKPWVRNGHPVLFESRMTLNFSLP